MGARAVSLGRFVRLLGLHEVMLADARRNRAFERALARVVRPGVRVLDIGAGIGVWAVKAARLGAARVVALEKEPLLAPVIEQLARENGVQDRIEVVTGDSRHVRLSGRFDVVVSETIGAEAFEEGIVPLLRDARRRFLAPGGCFVPQAVSLMAVPVQASLLQPAGLSLRTGHWEALLAHVPRLASRRVRALAAPATLLQADFRGPLRVPRAQELCASWTIGDTRSLTAVALCVEAQLAPGVRLQTLSGTSWPATLLPVGPFAARRGTLSFTLSRRGRVRCWRASLRSRRGVEVQDSSALLAYGALRGRLGRDQ